MIVAILRSGVLRRLLAVCAVLLVASPAWARYGGGNGTPDDPYVIRTVEDLRTLAMRPEDWDGHCQLVADLDLVGQEIPVIGTFDAPFTGVFDGNHRSISNLSIVRQSFECEGDCGLFGRVAGEGSRIANLVLIRPEVVSECGWRTGALAGRIEYGTIENCHVRGGTIRGSDFVGGLVGRNNLATIAGCTVTARVTGVQRVGGLVGQSHYGMQERCRVEADVQGLASGSWAVGGLIGEDSHGRTAACHVRCWVMGDSTVGGLAGDSYLATVERCGVEGTVVGETDVGGLIGRSGAGRIRDCYSVAEVAGSQVLGGLVGRHGASCYCAVYTPGSIVRCYAAGPVTGGDETGGLIGRKERSDVEHAFWDVEVAGRTNSDGGHGLTTQQMCDPETFTGAGWDLTDTKGSGGEGVWRQMSGRSAPRLAWMPVQGDFNGDTRADLRDYAIFADRWRQLDTVLWSGGVHLSADGTIDLDDLASLAGDWLGPVQ